MRKRPFVPKVGTSYALADAALFRGPLVYGLYGGDGVVFYVGQTIDAPGRFKKYADRPETEKNVEKRRLIREAGDEMRVVVLEHNPVDLLDAERRHIAAHVRTAVNHQGNPHLVHTTVKIKTRSGLSCRELQSARAGQPVIGKRHLKAVAVIG